MCPGGLEVNRSIMEAKHVTRVRQMGSHRHIELRSTHVNSCQPLIVSNQSHVTSCMATAFWPAPSRVIMHHLDGFQSRTTWLMSSLLQHGDR